MFIWLLVCTLTTRLCPYWNGIPSKKVNCCLGSEYARTMLLLKCVWYSCLGTQPWVPYQRPHVPLCKYLMESCRHSPVKLRLFTWYGWRRFSKKPTACSPGVFKQYLFDQNLVRGEFTQLQTVLVRLKSYNYVWVLCTTFCHFLETHV